MTAKYCRECGSRLKPGAKFCSSCGVPAFGRSSDPGLTTEPSDAREVIAKRFVMLMVGVFGIFAILVGGRSEGSNNTALPSSSGSAEDVRMGDESLAWGACKREVKKLMAPRSARFPAGEFIAGPSVGRPNAWLIKSYVDTENGFGAATRLDWMCEVDFSRGDYSPVILDLQID